jgi:hypothetical protein
VLCLFAAAVVAATTSPPPAPSLPTIVTVKASTVCTALRQSIPNVLAGMMADDNLLAEGRALEGHLAPDAADQPKNTGSATGGAGAASEMDDYQMLKVVHDLASNVQKLDGLLSDTTLFPKGSGAEGLEAARQQLQAVVDDQRFSLNVLSGIAYSNAANDLNSRSGIIGINGGVVPASAPPRLTAPEALTYGAKRTDDDERLVSQAIVGLAKTCKSP